MTTKSVLSALLSRAPWKTFNVNLADPQHHLAIEQFHGQLGARLWRHVNTRGRIAPGLAPIELTGLRFYLQPGVPENPVLNLATLKAAPPLAWLDENAADLDVLVWSDNIRDVFWFQALNVLQGAGGSCLGRCDCERLFVKVGKRRFCSTRCQRRVMMRVIRVRRRAELAAFLQGEQRGKTRTR